MNVNMGDFTFWVGIPCKTDQDNVSTSDLLGISVIFKVRNSLKSEKIYITARQYLLNSLTYIFQLSFWCVCVWGGPKGAFNLSNQVRLFITSSLYKLRYKFLFFRHRFQVPVKIFLHELISLLILSCLANSLWWNINDK